MRPSSLDPIFAEATVLKGVGPRIAPLLGRLTGRESGARIVDLLLHLPSGVIDRRARPRLADLVAGQIATVEVTVDRHRPSPPGRSRAPYLVYAHDETGDLIVAFFGAMAKRLASALPVGETRFVSGTVEFFDGIPQMVHPDRVADAEGFEKLSLVEPVYPLTEGIGEGMMRRYIASALERVPRLPEWHDPALLKREGFPPFDVALGSVHRPVEPDDASPLSPAWRRLAADELLAGQVALALVRREGKRRAGRPTKGDGAIRGRLLAALPFALTGSQTTAIADIVADLESGERMIRLLQGDVGAGKTVVALLAMASVVEAGRQAAMMAPTEILARQHFATIRPLAEAAGLTVALLTGRDKGRERDRVLEGLATGAISIVLGTHAVFQDDVAFRDLALAVVDEQHRFGVHQRLAIAAKGEAADMLVMTATPIPRTLVLTYYGDMDVSRLTEKPPGRKPIETVAVPLERLGEVIERIAAAIEAGRRVFWVCPLVAESETLDLATAETRFAELARRFGPLVGMVHGQMPPRDKDRAMADFAAGETRILVATTVIEVGVDVPEASIMVIEHAERFGLAQLHQLRGRVGRGAAKSVCVLLYKEPLGETAKSRLAIMRETEDGFLIAEEDLKLRGEGDVLGTKQSGMPGFRVARMEFHDDLLEMMRKDAQRIAADLGAVSPERRKALTTLLHLHERADAVRLIEAG